MTYLAEASTRRLTRGRVGKPQDIPVAAGAVIQRGTVNEAVGCRIRLLRVQRV